MSLSAKRELVGRFRSEYFQADRAGKGRILDGLCQATGWSRKYAVQALRSLPLEAPGTKRSRRRVYGPQEEAALVRVWELSGFLASKRLAPFLEEFVEALERHGELKLWPACRERLVRMSASTIDRLLARHKRSRPPGYFSTKPGSLIKSQIAVRLGAGWDEARPGFVEVDTVHHCGGSLQGGFLSTLTMTDVATGWTELAVLGNLAQPEAMRGLRLLEGRLPFPLLGIDSDNGREFVHWSLVKFCKSRKIQFTRCRPYHKNDQCRVEQKNGALVRRHAGYGRYETPEQRELLRSLYGILRLLVNYFEPSLKAKEKAKTPYRRLLELGNLQDDRRRELEDIRLAINPADLRKELGRVKMRLLELDNTVRFLHDATKTDRLGF